MEHNQLTDADLLKMVQDEMARRGISTGPKRAGEDIQMSNQINMQMAGNPVSRTERMEAAENADRIAERNMARTAIGPMEAAVHGFNSGQTFGFFDEMMGMLGGDKLKETARDRQELGQKAYPGMTTGTEITGAVVSPTNKVFGPARTVAGGMRVGATAGAVDAAGRAEGYLMERADDAALGGATGLLFSAVGSGIGKSFTNRLEQRKLRRDTHISIEKLRNEKDAAYRSVDNSGEVFSGDEMYQLALDALDTADNRNFVAEADPQTAAVLKTLENRAGQSFTLSQLDKLRQNFWLRYTRGNEPAILDIIHKVDELIDSRAAASSAMRQAREKHARFAKAQVLDNAFHDAKLRAAGSDSALIGRYKQAVLRVLSSPKESRFFSKDELALMEVFVMSNDSDKWLRRAGKLAPSGSGLMSILNLYGAVAFDPAVLAGTAAAEGAKHAADRSAVQAGEQMRNLIASGNAGRKLQPADIAPVATGAAVGGNSAY